MGLFDDIFDALIPGRGTKLTPTPRKGRNTPVAGAVSDAQKTLQKLLPGGQTRTSNTASPVPGKVSGKVVKGPKVKDYTAKEMAASNAKAKARNAFINRGSGTAADFERLYSKASAGKSTGSGEAATRRAANLAAAKKTKTNARKVKKPKSAKRAARRISKRN